MQDLIIWELAEVCWGTWFRSLFYGIDGYIVSNACSCNSRDCQVWTKLTLRLWKLEWKIAYFVNPFASWRSIWKQTFTIFTKIWGQHIFLCFIHIIFLSFSSFLFKIFQNFECVILSIELGYYWSEKITNPIIFLLGFRWGWLAQGKSGKGSKKCLLLLNFKILYELRCFQNKLDDWRLVVRRIILNKLIFHTVNIH